MHRSSWKYSTSRKLVRHKRDAAFHVETDARISISSTSHNQLGLEQYDIPEALRIRSEVEASAREPLLWVHEGCGYAKARTYLRRDTELKDLGYRQHCPGCQAAWLWVFTKGAHHENRSRHEIDNQCERTIDYS
eukprot:3436823-Amphidinium_carterae.1